MSRPLLNYNIADKREVTALFKKLNYFQLERENKLNTEGVFAPMALSAVTVDFIEFVL